jgi:curved DNA-binding protein CbpA
MEDGDDPYHILGVPNTATAAEIRSAYRRLAMQHHPDKQQTAEDKERVTPLFVKISNAYEVLSDPEDKARYDHQQQQPSSVVNNTDHPFAFHDPFQLFEELFQSQLMHRSPLSSFGGMSMGMNTTMNMGGMSMGMNTTMNMGGPFLGGFEGLLSQPSLGIPFMSPLAMMSGGMSLGTMTFSSCSGGTQASSVSVATTTRIVNGQRETRIERIIRHPDGTTERIVETPQPEHPRIEPPPVLLPSAATLLSTEKSSAPKRKDSSVKSNATKDRKPRKRRKTNTPEDGDKNRPIVLE